MRRSVLAAVAVVVLLGIWMASGLVGGGADDAADAGDAASAPMSVAVTTVSPEPMQREIVVHGELSARRKLHVRAETSGTVETLAVARGARVARGDTLATLDEGEREAALREARARLTTARSEQDAASSLRRQGLQSQVQLEQSRAAFETAQAQLARVERDLANTVIAAPFDGVVNDLAVEQGQLVERGDPIAELVDDGGFEVGARVAQQRLAELALGQAVTIEPITGGTLRGRLSWISASADPASRSFAVEATVENGDAALSDGISATLRIPVETVEAVFVTPSALALGEGGELGVKIVDAEERVRFVPVTLVSTSLEGAWVAGMEAGSRLITLGQGFVNAGDRVRAQPAETPAADAVAASRGDP